MSLEDKLKLIRFNRLEEKDIILAALTHVKNYIVANKLILVGGMAIDQNLRLKGTQLYSDNELPDYDFYSPDNVASAYELGSQLCKSGEFPNVDVITALHTTTMKVRVMGHVVADITYMPPELFKLVPTLEVSGLRFAHPYMTMMDQYTSLCGPFENPPREVVLERWTKDQKRYNMLLEHYPLPPVVIDKPDKKSKSASASPRPESLPPGKFYHGGWTAVKNIIEDLGLTNDIPWDLPKDHEHIFYYFDSEDFAPEARKKLAGWQHYNETFSYFRSLQKGNTRIYMSWGFCLTLWDNQNISIFALLWYFMYMHIFHAGEDHAALGLNVLSNLANRCKPEQLFSIKTAPGARSWKHSTLYSIASVQDYQRIKNWKPQNINMANSCNYNETGFDYSQSPLFQIQGAPVEHWPEHIIPDPQILEIGGGDDSLVVATEK